jgi:hypothetical protein
MLQATVDDQTKEGSFTAGLMPYSPHSHFDSHCLCDKILQRHLTLKLSLMTATTHLHAVFAAEIIQSRLDGALLSKTLPPIFNSEVF